MKKYTLLLMAMLLTAPVFAAGKQLSAMFGYSIFYLPESNQPYVETYFNFDAWSLNFVADGSAGYRATVEITIVARQEDTIAYVKKYDLHSPYTDNPESTGFTFFDLQRFGLHSGFYDLEITLRDKASDNAPLSLVDKLVVYFPEQKPSMYYFHSVQVHGSDFQLYGIVTIIIDNYIRDPKSASEVVFNRFAAADQIYVFSSLFAHCSRYFFSCFFKSCSETALHIIIYGNHVTRNESVCHIDHLKYNSVI